MEVIFQTCESTSSLPIKKPTPLGADVGFVRDMSKILNQGSNLDNS
jgi:hypothetical protein